MEGFEDKFFLSSDYEFENLSTKDSFFEEGFIEDSIERDNELVPTFEVVHRACTMILEQKPSIMDELREYKLSMGFEEWKHPVLETHVDPFDKFLYHLLRLVVIGDHGLLVRLRRELYSHIPPNEAHTFVNIWRNQLLLHGSYDDWARQLIQNDFMFAFVADQHKVLPSIQAIVWHLVTEFNNIGFALVCYITN